MRNIKEELSPNVVEETQVKKRGSYVSKKKNVTINIVDEIMGKGKTSAIINMINSSYKSQRRFIFITPYLDEVERVKKECKSKNFKEPTSVTKSKTEKAKTKLASIKELIRANENIVSTHALFKLLDDEAVLLIRDGNYTLIMDEVANVIEQFDGIEKSDFKDFSNKLMLDKRNTYKFKESTYKGRFSPEKKMCDMDALLPYGDQSKHILIMWAMPIKIFKVFNEIYILTYMFEAQKQKYYYDYFGVKYRYLYVNGNSKDTYTISETKEENINKTNFRELIKIYDNEKSNTVGKEKSSLSKTWYMEVATEKEIQEIKKNCTNFFNNYCETKSQFNIWTTFKYKRSAIAFKGYSKGFVPLNARATNAYQETYAAAYLVNIYFNPFIKGFFATNGIKVDDDKYAISEMVQWLWRTRIRKGEQITVYIPSSRMRELLKQWIEENSPADTINTTKTTKRK